MTKPIENLVRWLGALPHLMSAFAASIFLIQTWKIRYGLIQLSGELLPLESLQRMLPMFSPILSLGITYLIWRSSRHIHPFVDQHGKESCNFQFTIIQCVAIEFALFIFFGIFQAINEFSNMMCGYPGCYKNKGTELFNNSILIVFLMPILIQLALSVFAAIRALYGKDIRYPKYNKILR